MIRATFWGVAVLALMFSQAAYAEEPRPAIERNTAAMCAKADVDGDSYRPFVCDARCDCLVPVLQAGNFFPSILSGCSETSPGEFELQVSPPCSGSCSDINFPCVEDGNPPGCGFCTFHSGGVQTGACAGSTCLLQSDCPPGYVCNQFGNNSCTIENACGADDGSPGGIGTPCPPGLPVTLSGVETADSPNPVTCDPEGPIPAVKINSRDALECITQIEAAIGQSCTPAP